MVDKDIKALTKSIERLGGTFGSVAKKGIGFMRTLETIGDIAELTASIINVKTVKAVSDLGTQLATTSGAATRFAAAGGTVTTSASQLSGAVVASTAKVGVLSSVMAGLAASAGPLIIALGVLVAGFIAFKVAAAAVKKVVSIVKKSIATVISVFDKLVQVGKKLISIGAELAKSFFAKVASAAKNLKDRLVDLISSGVTRLIDELMTLEARVEGISYDFELLADRAGIGGTAMLEMMRDASSRMVSDLTLMQQYNKAAQGVSTTFAETLPQALIYFGQISLATGDTVEYLLSSYVRGIQKLSPLILDNLNIQVSLAQASEQAALMFGKSTDALTRAEKQAGMTVLVMNKLALAVDGLPGPMGTLAQKVAAIETRFKNFKDTLMMIFLPAAKAVADLILGIMDSVEGSGIALRYVSAVIKVLAEELLKLVNIGADAADRFKTGFTDKLIATASAALEWGAKIAVNLAIGIIEGGGRALIGAMNWISSLLEYWLAPGSAPLVAPLLGAWGADAFTEWLRGFTNADFDVLEGIQAPLLRALKIVTGDGEFGETFAEITEAMAAYLAGSSSLEDVLASLTSVGGAYGDELSTLFQRMLAVADATTAVEAAEKRLADAQNKYKKNRTALIDGAREYNKLLRSGADAATLKAKMAQLKTNYKNMKAAEKQVEEEETNLDIAKEQLKVMKQQAKAQERLLNQLLKLAEMAARAGDGDGDGGTFPGLPELPDITPVITSIDEAFDAIYARVRERLEEIWAMVVQTWEESEAGEVFALLLERWQSFYEETLKPFIDDIFIPWFETSLERIKQVGFWKWLGEEIIKFGQTLPDIWENKIKPALIKFNNWFLSLLPEGLATFIRNIEDFVSSSIKAFMIWVPPIVKLFGYFLESLEKIGINIGTILETLGFDTEEFEATWGETWGTKLGYYVGMAVTAILALVVLLTGALASITGVVATMVLGVVSWFDGLKTAIQTVKDTFIDLYNKAAEINWFSLGRTLRDRFLDGFRGIASCIKGTLNIVIGSFEAMINNAIYGLNLLIWAINNIPGVSANYLDYINLPRLETGGMVTATEQLALLHGQEVVLPLNDPRTTKALADAMKLAQVPGTGQDITINNYFGPGSVRRDSDIDEMADAIQRRLELRGVRERL